MGTGSKVCHLWRRNRVRTPLTYEIGESAQRLVISPTVLNHFLAHQQLDRYSLEAGGQLFAQFSEDKVTICKATGPRAADLRSRCSYLPSRQEEQKEIDKMHRQGFHFVGDWHTHPEPAPIPSRFDKETIKDAVAKSRHHLNGFIMVVIGNGSFPGSLHVSFNTATEHLKLKPT